MVYILIWNIITTSTFFLLSNVRHNNSSLTISSIAYSRNAIPVRIHNTLIKLVHSCHIRRTIFPTITNVFGELASYATFYGYYCFIICQEYKTLLYLTRIYSSCCSKPMPRSPHLWYGSTKILSKSGNLFATLLSRQKRLQAFSKRRFLILLRISSIFCEFWCISF